MQVNNGGVTLEVTEDGDPDAPPVLLIHGITSSFRTWDWFVPLLSARFRVLRLDLRGHGSSDRVEDGYQLAGYVSDAIAAGEQAAGGPAVVIGHSLGGATAIGMAQQRPDLVRALVLEDPPLATAGESLEGNSLLDGFRLMRESVPRLQASGIDENTLSDVLGKAPSPVGAPFAELVHHDALHAMAAGLLALDPRVLDPVLSGESRVGLDTDTPVEAPTLLMTADPSSPDAVARPEGVERFRSVCPGVEVCVLEGASHLIHDEKANRAGFVRLVTGLLAELV